MDPVRSAPPEQTAITSDAAKQRGVGRVKRASLAAAMAEWERLLGSEFITDKEAAIESAEHATYPTKERVSAILRPGCRDEVQACVQVANAHNVPLYPVSSGKNWGFGSRVPTLDECVIMDLARLDRIIELDEELAYVVVEPGVTQRALYSYLQEHTNGRLWIDATSSSFDCSVIGNLLERGHGVTMYCDHVACSANYEIVLANGECIHTGYGAFENAGARNLDAWGIGPSLTGLFSQSNFGIVTRATIWLMRAPEQAVLAFFTIDSEDSFSRLIDELRPLRLDRILKSGPFLGNVYQALQKVMTYPWDATGGAAPLSLATALKLAAPHRYDLWNGSIGLYGTAEEVALQRDRLTRALEGKAKWSAFIESDLTDIESLFPRSRHREVRAVAAGFTGGVGGTGLPAAYWRMQGPPPATEAMDLDRDGCGFKFWTATSPFRGSDARAVTSLATETLLRHGFEPSIGIFPVRERTLQYHIACAYDRRNAQDDAAIIPCHEELRNALMDSGYYPTRLGIGSMDVLERCDPAYERIIQSLKDTFDPKNILAPARYVAPRSE
jgi:4-cresol dehydrogenase (hydroxylating)